MLLKTEIKLAGHITALVTRSDGSLKTREDFHNLITDVGMDALGNYSMTDAGSGPKVGSGTTAPTFADTDLEAEITGAATPISSTFSHNSGAGGQWIVYYTRVFTYAPGQIIGTVSEVGFFGTSGMFSRALVTDFEDEITSVVVLEDESLTIVYEQRKVVPNTDYSATITTEESDDYDYTIRAIGVDNAETYNYWSPDQEVFQSTASALETDVLADQDSYPGGADDNANGYSYLTYVPGSYESLTNFNWVPTNAIFTSGIGSITFCITYSPNPSASAGFQCNFSPKIPKTDEDALDITFSVSWSRA